MPLLDDGIEAEAAVVHDIAYRAAGDSGANTAAQGFDLRFGIGVLIAYEDARAGHDIAGISRVQRFLAAEVQAGGRGYHDQHHRCENAYRRKTRAVALHAVCHRGHGHEVLGLIVIAFIFLKQPAHHDAARNEDEIGRCDDH